MIQHCLRSFIVFSFLVLCCAEISSSNAQSSTKGTLSGILTERSSGEAIIGATVALYKDSTTLSGRPLRGAVSNKFGFYSIANVEPGSYYLVTKAISYFRFSQQITIEPDKPLRLDITLVPEGVKGKEVVVEDTRDASGTREISSISVKPEMIQKLPALGGETDIYRALQLLPGVKSVSEISSGLYVRGGSPDQNLNLLDGVTIYNPSHLGGFLSTFNSDAVRDIRLIKGAFPAEYGGRLSSVIDLTMKEGTKEKISGTAGVSLINSRLTLEGPLTENSTFMISGRRLYLDLLILAAAPKDEPVPDYYFYDLNGKVNYKLGESDHLYLSGYFGRDVFDLPVTEQDSIFSDINWGNAAINLRWAHIISPELFTNFSAIYSDYKFDALIQDISASSSGNDNFKSISGIRDFLLRGEASYYPSEDHTIKTGLEVTEHRFRADASVEVKDFAQIAQTPNIINSFDGSLYAQDEWKWGAKLSGNFGARAYYFEKGNYFRLEPRVSLAYMLDENSQIHGSFATGNQFLHLIVRNDIALPTDVWFPSTEIVKPAESIQGVLGFETNLFDREYVLSVEGYYKTMKNLLEYKDTASFSLNVPLETAFTRGTGEAYGVEFFLNKKLGALTGWLGYTLSWATRTFPELNRGKTFYPRYDRRHDISAVLTYRIGESWEFGAAWTYGTGQAYTVPTGAYKYPYDDLQYTNKENLYYNNETDFTERNNYRIPAFHKLDLNFTHSFSWFNLPWQFSINIYNAYSRKNVFAQDVSTVSEDGVSKYKIRQYTLFPIIPTFGLSCKF